MTERLIGGPLTSAESFELMELVPIAAMMRPGFTFDLASSDRREFEAMLTLRPEHGIYVIGSGRS